MFKPTLTTLFLLVGFVFSVGAESLEPAPEVASDANSASGNFRSWPALRSDIYPLIVYSKGEKLPKEFLSRLENTLRGFERDFPGFTFQGMPTLEIPIAWNASSSIRAGRKDGAYLLPLDATDKMGEMADHAPLHRLVNAALNGALRSRTSDSLPEWFYQFVTAEYDWVFLTGSTPQRMFNPNNTLRMIRQGKFLSLGAIAQRAARWSDTEEEAPHGEISEDYAGWMSCMMYVLYAKETADGKELRKAIANALLAASADVRPMQVDAEISALLAKAKGLDKTLKEHWLKISPTQYILAQQLEGIARLWTTVAVEADSTGTRYANFADLRAAVESGNVPLPPDVPPSLLLHAKMFLDRDGAYTLTWTGKTANIRLVSREGWRFSVSGQKKEGLVEQEATRYEASPGEIASLPSPDSHPFHSSHFILISDCETERAADLLPHCDLFFEHLVDALPWKQPEQTSRKVMYFYSDAWAVGLSDINFYNPMSGTIYVSPLGDDATRHELTHQIVDLSSKGEFAWWVNEGIAEYYGRHITYAGDDFIGPAAGDYDVKQVQEYLAGNWGGRGGALKIPDFVQITPREWSAYKHRGYTIAWSLIHFLKHADNGTHRKLVDDYLQAVATEPGTGTTERNAAFGEAVKNLEPQWRAYWTAASNRMKEPARREAFVRLIYLLHEQARLQFPEEMGTGKFLPPSVLKKLAPPPRRADHISSQILKKAGEQPLWQYEWAVTGTGSDTRITCTFKDGTVAEVWRDSDSKKLASALRISPSFAEVLAKSTLPEHRPAPKISEHKASPAQKSSGAVGGGNFAPASTFDPQTGTSFKPSKAVVPTGAPPSKT